MTREETVAAYKACMIILTRREGAALLDTRNSDPKQFGRDIFHNMDMMEAIFKINEALDLSALDMTVMEEASKMDDKKVVLIITAMDNITAIKAYIAMMTACYVLGHPTATQIEWFNIFGQCHGLTFEKLKQLVLKS